MFGILHSLFIGGAFIAGEIKEQVDREKYKTRRPNYENKSYYDRHCVERLLENDHPIVLNTLSNGDKVYIDCKTQRIVRNVTQERKAKELEQRRQDAIDNGKTVYLYEDVKINHVHEFFGKKYKDLKTGEIYYINGCKGLSYYITLDGKVVRLTDKCKKQLERNNYYQYDDSDIQREMRSYQERINEHKKNGDYHPFGDRHHEE